MSVRFTPRTSMHQATETKQHEFPPSPPLHKRTHNSTQEATQEDRKTDTQTDVKIDPLCIEACKLASGLNILSYAPAAYPHKHDNPHTHTHTHTQQQLRKTKKQNINNNNNMQHKQLCRNQMII